MVYIYILQLYNNKYYIGKTNNPKFRIKNHFNSNGTAWTLKYKPIKVIKLIPNCDSFDEDKYTLKYMEKYGINNVRGGSFCQLKLSYDNKKIINKMIKSTTDKCYKCNEKGHFASECPHNSDESSQEEEEELTIENLEEVFAEENKDDGVYEWNNKEYLWYDGELFEESTHNNCGSRDGTFYTSEYDWCHWRPIKK